MYDVTVACAANLSPSVDLVYNEDFFATSIAFLRRFEKRRTFSDESISVTATLADPSGVCGKNQQGIKATVRGYPHFH